MNYMKQVAEMLGVELGEKFKVEVDGAISLNIFLLTEYGLSIDGGDEVPLCVTLNDLLTGKIKLIKLSKQPLPILDENEKEYLSAVIKPFRNKIEYIIKYLYEDGEYISIIYKVSNDGTSSMIFPSYDKGTTYKGMELGKKYTLEELGL